MPRSALLVAAACLAFTACSFGLADHGPAPSSDAEAVPPPTSTVIEYLGDAAVLRDGFVLPADRVLAGQPLDVCVQSYPTGSATRAFARWTRNAEPREFALAIAAEDAGPFGHNTLWCGQLAAADLTDSLALQLVAEDASGAVRTVDLAVTASTDIALFADPAHLATWRMAGPGAFTLDGNNAIVAQPRQDLGLYWAAIPTPADFDLSLDWQLSRTDDNSGVFLRFRDPDSFGYDNPAWVGVHDGLEIQIDDTARPDGADVHRTGALYEQPGTYVRPSDSLPGTWRHFEIAVRGARVTVTLDGALVSDTTFSGDPQYPDRARPSAPGAPRFIGLQTHTGAVMFRNVRLCLP